MKYPKGFEYLGEIGTLPKLVTAGLLTYGVREIVGPKHSPIIMKWAKETGLNAEGYTADEVPWCGLWMAKVVLDAGYQPVKHPLWALNWGQFGQKVYQPILGSILSFVRDGGGHVGEYLGEDKTHYAVLGGNTSNSVDVGWIAKTRLRAAREPIYRVGRPESAKPYFITRTGAISTNEA